MKKLFIQLIAFVLCITMICPALYGCTKKVDPEYIKGSDTTLTYEIVNDPSNLKYIIEPGDEDKLSETGLPLNTNIVREGSSASAKWERQDSKTSIYLSRDNMDVSKYTSINLWMYSEKITSSQINLCIYCTPEGNNTVSYVSFKISVNWTGWKLVTINFSEFTITNGPNLSNVENIRLHTTGWSMTPDPETVIYIDSVYFATDTYKFNLSEDQIGDFNYDHIKQTLVDLNTGGVTFKKASSDAKKQLKAYTEEAEKLQRSMRRNKKSVPFNTDMSTTEGLTVNYSSIRSMALGYSIKGGDLYKDEDLLDDILYALEYMHENYYKDQSLHSYPTLDNWYHWEIACGQAIVDILLMIEDEIDQATIDKYLEPVNRYVPLPTMTMANRVDLAYVTIGASALQKDYKRLALSRDALNECCVYVEKGDGFYTDGSFIQHTVYPYTGSYGPIMLEALSKLILATNDTCFRFSDEFIGHQYDWAVNSFAPLMYHGAFFGLVRGRSISRSSTDVGLGMTAVQGMLRMTKYLNNTDKSNNIKSILKEYYNYNKDYYRSKLSPYDLKIFDDILDDKSVKERTDFTFAKIFARMDRPIAQFQKYGVGIALSSSRVAKYESINGENKQGWYTGDGMLYVYTSVSDYDPEFWRNVNPYRIPGTTVTKAPRLTPDRTANYLPDRDFVGGVSLEKSMVAAMDFESSATDFESSLTGKKAWFVFDNEIVCLGAGISSSDAYATETIIENRRLAITQKFMADGSSVMNSYGTLYGKSSLYIENFGCIYLPEKTEVSFNRTTGKVPFLELYINHGVNFENDSYSYVLLPLASDSEGTAYASKPDIEILVNSDTVMAVKDNSTGMIGYIFWEAGSFNGVTVSNPCTLMVSSNKIAVADPTQKLTSIDVTVNGTSYNVTGLYKGATVELSK